MEDYPRNITELEARFGTEKACREYLFRLRWPDGFRCPRCGSAKAWTVGPVLLQCGDCSCQTSVTAGTIFQGTRKPLTLWFRAMWWGHIVDFGGIYDSWQQLGPMARRVEDLALILPLISGPDFHDATIVPVPWRDPASVDVPKLRVAFYVENGVAETSPETRDAVRRAAKFLADAGCDVREDLPKEALMDLEEVRLKLEGADAGAYLQRLSKKWGTKTMSPALADRFFRLQELPMPEFTEVLEKQDAGRSRLLSWIKNYDVVLTPAAGQPAQPIDTVPNTTPPKPGADYTRVHNTTGWPAAVVRAGTSPEGLPIGVQVIGQPWREDVVLAVCEYLESKTGGWQKPAI